MATRLLEARRDRLEATFFCHPKEVSNVRGQRNENIKRLRECFEVKSISIKESEAVPKGSLLMQTSTGEVMIQRKDLVE